VVTLAVSRQLIECVFVEEFQVSESSPTASDYHLSLVLAKTEKTNRVLNRDV